MRKYNSLILHVIGSKKEVVKASNEIYQYTIDHYFTTKIIQNNCLFKELYQNANADIYINECNSLNCEEIKNVHNSLYYRFYRNPMYSYAIYVNQPPFFCPYIDNVYSLTDKKNEKGRILHHILFTKRNQKNSYQR